MNFVEIDLDDGLSEEDLFEYVSDFTDELVLLAGCLPFHLPQMNKEARP